MLELALHVLDVLQNSIAAGAERVVLTIDEDLQSDLLSISVADDGCGMDADAVRQVTNPFYTTRTTRHVGLGLPLFRMAAEQAEGKLTVTSAPGLGTTVAATFRYGHPDRQPMGDMAATLLAFLLSGRPVRLMYSHRVGEAAFEFDTADIRAELGALELHHPRVAQWLAEYLTEGEAALV